MKATELDLVQLQVRIAKEVFGYKAIPAEAWLHIGKMSLKLLECQGYDISELEGNDENTKG